MCFKCLASGHISKSCNTSLCNVIANGHICQLNHHKLLHDLFRPKLTIPSRSSNVYVQKNLIFPISNVVSLNGSLNVLWNEGSIKSSICQKSAISLNLKKVNSNEYIVPLVDKFSQTHNIIASEVDNLLHPINYVNSSLVAELFPEIDQNDLGRPFGNLDLSIGVEYCNLLPKIMATNGNLQVMSNVFGKCLRGSHPLIDTGQSRNRRVY